MSRSRKALWTCAGLLAASACAGLACGPLLRVALVKAGERAFGAAVDIGSARLNLFTATLELRSVAAADKRRPLRNLFLFDKAVFRLSPRGLLRGRLEATEADVTGLTVGGPRRGNGALPGPSASAFEKSVDGQLDMGVDQAERALDRAAARLSRTSARFAAGRAWKRLDGEVSAARRSRAKARLARDRQLVEQARQELDEPFEEAGRDLARAQDALLAPGTAKSLDRRLLGRAAAHSVVTALSLVRLARAAETSRTRPYLVIDAMRLTGRVAGAFAGRPMDLEGMVLGLSSDARAYGKPTRLIFKGESADGSAVLGMQGIIDDGQDPPRTELAFHCTGMSLAGDELGDPSVGASVETGVARVNGALSVEGRRWSGRFSLSAGGVRLSPHAAAAEPAAGRVLAALSRLRRFDADVAVDGDEEDLAVDLASDLGPAVERALAGAALDPSELDGPRRRQALERLRSLRRRQAGLRARLSAPLRRYSLELAAAAQNGQSLEVSLPPARAP